MKKYTIKENYTDKEIKELREDESVLMIVARMHAIHDLAYDYDELRNLAIEDNRNGRYEFAIMIMDDEFYDDSLVTTVMDIILDEIKDEKDAKFSSDYDWQLAEND